MLLRSKKGMVLYYIILIGFLFAIIYYFLSAHYVKPANQPGFAGEMQLKFLEEASKVQGKRYYFEQVAKESAHETARNISYLGGFRNLNLDCGIVGSISFWNNETNYCWPEYKKNFLISFDNNFLEEISETGINYDYFVKEKTLVGAADDVLLEDFNYGGRLLGQLAWRPSFSVEIDYNLDEYEDLFAYARELIVGCSEEGEGCIDRKLGEFNAESDLKWQKGDCTGTFDDVGDGRRVFCVKGKKLRVFDGEEYVEKQVEYQFGLNFAGEKEALT
ncbi:MAG: hypothetical protein KAT77_02100 [Nanoarchaeota archaeon]|nr:hypothetical protein [Nanoarchaeota archaeon]